MTNEILMYFVRIGDCLSQLVNVVFFWSLNPNESVSGRAERLHKISTVWGCVRFVINGVFFWEPNHCFNAYIADKDRARRMLENV